MSATARQNRSRPRFTRSNILIAAALSNTLPASDTAFSRSARRRSAPRLPLYHASTSSAIASSPSSSGYILFTSSHIPVPFISSITFAHSALLPLRRAAAHRCAYSCTALSLVAIFGSRYILSPITNPYTSPLGVRKNLALSLISMSPSLNIT